MPLKLLFILILFSLKYSAKSQDSIRFIGKINAQQKIAIGICSDVVKIKTKKKLNRGIIVRGDSNAIIVWTAAEKGFDDRIRQSNMVQIQLNPCLKDSVKKMKLLEQQYPLRDTIMLKDIKSITVLNYLNSPKQHHPSHFLYWAGMITYYGYQFSGLVFPQIRWLVPLFVGLMASEGTFYILLDRKTIHLNDWQYFSNRFK
jgi:hypothetical protein